MIPLLLILTLASGLATVLILAAEALAAVRERRWPRPPWSDRP